MNIVNSFQSLPNKNQIECPICLEIIDNDNAIFSECKHTWCKDCGKNIANNSCPICRKKILGKTVHGHLEKVNDKYVWISIEDRIKSEIREAEKRLNTKEYRNRRMGEMNDIICLGISNLTFIHSI